ncbi:putative membrane-associated protein [Gammaproteobacteria bacterium]
MSSYIQKTLLPEEKILYYTKPHYVVFYPVLLWLVFAAWFLTSSIVPKLFGHLLMLMGLFSCIGELIAYNCSEYVITDKRIIMKVGFIRRRSLELFIDRIEGVYVEQSIIGRILGFGTVIVGGIGGTKDTFFYIPNPIEFRNKMQQQIQIITKR